MVAVLRAILVWNGAVWDVLGYCSGHPLLRAQIIVFQRLCIYTLVNYNLVSFFNFTYFGGVLLAQLKIYPFKPYSTNGRVFVISKGKHKLFHGHVSPKFAGWYGRLSEIRYINNEMVHPHYYFVFVYKKRFFWQFCNIWHVTTDTCMLVWTF